MENDPQAPKTGKSKSFKVILLASAVIVVAAVVMAVVLLGAEDENEPTANAPRNNTTNNQNANTNETVPETNHNTNTAITIGKVQGQSSGTLPYAVIDGENTASAVIDSSGGVLKAALPKNVIAYFILPRDEVIQGATVSLVPYTAMPSGPQHGLLSDEYGYGVQVQIQSLQMGIRGYLVFDLTGGTASQEARAKEQDYNRCDPGLPWFDPYLCAKKNNVPATTVITKDTTVITPIHVERANTLVFSQNTIPTGIDGLIALRIEGGDVFIPQKLDQDLAERLVQDTLSNRSSNAQKLEAVGLALAWNINTFSQDQMELVSQLNDGEWYEETLKAISVSRQFDDRLKAGDFTITRGDFDDRTDEELVEAIEENMTYLTETFLEDALDVTTSFGFGLDSVMAAAAISDAAELDLAGADEALGTVTNTIESTASDDASSIARRSSALKSADYTGDPTMTQESLQQVARDVVNHVWADENATIEEILNAMYLARVTGLDDWEQILDEGLAKIQAIIEEMLEDAEYADDYLDIAEIACALGFEDICQEAVGKAKTAPPMPAELCDLVKKNLSNYGVNECGR